MTQQTLHTNTPVKAEFSVPATNLPSSARVVIVGGGIAGTAVAYQLGLAGWDDVLLLEQHSLAAGTTWHSAGQVGQLRSSSAQTKINKASTEIYAGLLADTGHDPGWLRCGGLQLASTQERLYQLQRNTAMAEVFGIEASMISADDCRGFWPMLRTDDLTGGAYLPGDGRVLPGECTIALAMGAMQRGVMIHERTRVTGLVVAHRRHGIRRITGVRTDRGEITADWVILAANMWMRQLGMEIGIDIPVYPCEHHYVITTPVPGVTRNNPCTRDPDAGLYFRALDDGAMKLGAFKKRSKPWQIGDRVPNDFSFGLLEPDWPDFAEPFAALAHRLPGLRREHVVKFINGPEAFTPDNNFIIGQPFLTEGLFVLGGWNSAGIACSAGAARYAVEWIENGGMTIDLSSVDIRRFQPFQNGRSYLQARVREVLGLHYQMAWPGRQMETARGIRQSPLHEQHRLNNACFGETAGWERPLFYPPPGKSAEIEYSFLSQNWQAYTAAEVRQCRRDVALLDQSTFAKYRLQGPDSVAILQQLCGANIDVPIGCAAHTGMFNERGTFECDLIVIREECDSFYLVTAAGGQQKDFDWISRNLPAGAAATLTDITEQVAVLSVMGKHSRDKLRSVCRADLSNAAFPYGTSQVLQIAGITVRALRVSYVGELGWELHVASPDAESLWDALMPLRPIGHHAISTMRIEKSHRAMGHELSADVTPLEAGLAFTIDWHKEFIGKSALLVQRERGVRRRLVNFVLEDPEVVLWGGEPITASGNIVGCTSSACYSPTLQRSVAMGYVTDERLGTAEDLQSDRFAIINLGRAHPARAGMAPPYDPHRTNVRC